MHLQPRSVHRSGIRAWLVVSVLISAAGGAAAGDDGRDPVGVLRVVSYNIRHGAGMDGRVDLERTAAVLQRLEPDLVALQEVDDTCRRSHGIDQAATLGHLLGMEHRFAASMDHDGGRYGLAVLSRMPVKSSRQLWLPRGDEPRSALEVNVEVPGLARLLSFICVHNDVDREATRVRQVRSLLDALGAADRPTIIAGDFNSEPGSESLTRLAHAGWTVLAKRGPTNTGATFRADAPAKEIDHFAVRGLPPFTIDHRVIPEQEASDHRPLLAVFTFVNDGEAVAK